MSTRNYLFICVYLIAALLASACSEAHLQQANQLGGSLLGKSGLISSSQTSALYRFGQSANKGLHSFSEEEEYFLGRGVAASIFSKYPPVRDERLHQYLAKVLAVVSAHSERPATFAGYHIAVLDTPEIMAVSAPGGFVFISTGFLRILNTEDELASVLAHEVVHISRRHGLAAISEANLTEALTILGSEAVRSQAQGIPANLTASFSDSISDITQTLLTTGYSRSQEFEADQGAAQILNRAGYDPRASLSVLEALAKSDASAAKGGWFETHPEARTRINELAESVEAESPAASLGQKVRDTRFNRAFGRL